MSVELTAERKLQDRPYEQYYENPAFEGKPGANGKTKSLDEMENGMKYKSDEVDDDDDDTNDYNAYQSWLLSVQEHTSKLYTSHEKVIWTAIGILLVLAYFGYFGYAMYYRFGDEGSYRLLGYTIFAVVVYVIVKLLHVYNENLGRWWESTKSARQSNSCSRLSIFINWCFRVGVLIAVVVYVIIDIALDQPGNLVTVGGLALYILIFYVTSINPAKVKWHTVFWGIALQYVFALIILRTQWGYDIFDWLGDRVSTFLDYTTAGVIFVFGEKYVDHFFAMKVMSIVIFFLTFVNVMYYLGVMQAVVNVLGRFLSFCMGTTPAESINAAGNIFVGQIEAPVMIRPFLEDMTKSELHAVMTGGFSTIAGSVLGAYISFGVPANHLISASVMSAPAALAISKLSYPETEKTKGTFKDFSRMEKSKEHNIVEAASNGASTSLKLVGAIAVNVLAFLSLLAFVNSSLTWFGNRVGVEDFTFEFICSYVLYPVSYFMGVETADCRKVAELIGVKTFTNEFIAYGNLKTYIDNRDTFNNYTEFFNTTGDWYYKDDDVVLNITGDVLKGGFLSLKSEVIATYALCGFANIGSIGIMLGGLGALAPARKSDLTHMVVRAMICGNAACFLTACVAGLLYKPF